MNLASKITEKILGSKPTSTSVQPKLHDTLKMNAIVWSGKKSVDYVEVPRPCITDPTDILLRVTATTICGSDLHLFKGTMLGMHEGDIIGHEFMGIVDEVGSAVKNLRVGQRVVVAFGIACGSCEYCLREEYTACDTTNPSKLVEKMYGHRPAAFYGYSHLTGGVPGGQAEYVRVPFADVNCCVIPDELPDDKALYLSDIIPTSFHGTQLGKVKKGDVVGIWGLGPIGLLTARWCQILGASKVIGIDKVDERIQLAKDFLGIDTINFKEKKVLEELETLAPGGVDVAIECAGFDYAKSLINKLEMALNIETDTAEIFDEMFKAVKKFGRVSVIGVYSGYANRFPVGAMMEKDLIIKCGQCPCQKYWKYCIEKLLSGEFDPSFVVTTKAHLSDAPQVYKDFNEKEGVIKVFLRPDKYSLDEKIIV